MRIATFNANSIRARLPIVLDWMEAQQPDILCIQETKAQDQDFPLEPFQEAGYTVTFRGEKSYNGVAVVSRARPTAVRFGLDDAGPSDDTRLVYARFGPLHVVNTYVPQGRDIEHDMYRYKIEWFQRLKAFFERNMSKRMKVLWLGDLNVANQSIDVHNPEKQAKHVCYHADARQAFADTIDWGFTDVFRKHHPEGGHYTFFDYRDPNSVKGGRGWRIDYLLATPSLARRCTDSFVDIEPRLLPKPSDHTFLVGDFDL